MLKHVYGSETLSRTQAFEWHRRFREGRESAEDDERSGRPVTSRTDENIKKVSAAVRANRQQTICQIAESVGISEATCQRILTKDLNMHRVCQHIVPRMLSEDQKGIRMEMAGDLITAVDKDPSLLGRIVTGDEKWCFLYDPQSKRASATWKSPQSPRKQKFRQDRSKGKVMLEVFFDIQGIVHLEFIPEGRTVNKELYVEILRRLRESIRKKRPKMWAEQSWVLLHDNAPAHRSLLVNDFLAKTKTTVLPHPPYSPDLAPCDFFLFTELARRLQGRRFQSSDEVKCASQAEIKDMAKNGFQTCFDELYRRWQKCVVAQGSYFEGGCVSAI